VLDENIWEDNKHLSLFSIPAPPCISPDKGRWSQIGGVLGDD